MTEEESTKLVANAALREINHQMVILRSLETAEYKEKYKELVLISVRLERNII